MDKETLHLKWQTLREQLEQIVGKKPKDLNAVLFLIGIQEVGKGKSFYSKEDKENLMHVAVCTLLMQEGYYEFESYDKDGWPHFKQLKYVDTKTITEQVSFIKTLCLNYFSTIISN